MIAINSSMFHELQLKNVLNGSFCAKESTLNHKYRGKEKIDEEILFNYETGETALVKMKIVLIEKQYEKQKRGLQYSVFAHFDLIRVIGKSGDVPRLYQDEKIIKKL